MAWQTRRRVRERSTAAMAEGIFDGVRLPSLRDIKCTPSFRLSPPPCPCCCSFVRLSTTCVHRNSFVVVVVVGLRPFRFVVDRANYNYTPQCPREVSTVFSLFYCRHFFTVNGGKRTRNAVERDPSATLPRVLYVGRGARHSRVPHPTCRQNGMSIKRDTRIFQDVVVPPEPNSGFLSVCRSVPSSIVPTTPVRRETCSPWFSLLTVILMKAFV